MTRCTDGGGPEGTGSTEGSRGVEGNGGTDGSSGTKGGGGSSVLGVYRKQFKVSGGGDCWPHGERIRAAVGNRYVPRLAPYLGWLTDEHTTTYSRQLTDEGTELCSSVEDIFLGSGTEEYKSTEECTLFSYSGRSMEFGNYIVMLM
jgi:hypothetical protein